MSTWLWEVPADPREIVRFARWRGVREVFVHGVDTAAARQCAALRSAGIGAACLAGDPRWVLDVAAAVAWLRAAVSRTGCATVHVDVEPWTLAEWPTQARSLAAAYADLIEACVAALPGIAVEIDVVPWLFDEWPAQARRALRAASSVTVLAYRDRAGQILRFAAPAIAEAHALGRPFRIGVETMPVGPGVPSRTTFADDGPEVLRRELASVDDALSGDPWYRGIAVHHWATWRALG